MDKLTSWVFRNKVFVSFELGVLVVAAYCLFVLLMAREDHEIAAAASAEESANEPAEEVKHGRRRAERQPA